MGVQGSIRTLSIQLWKSPGETTRSVVCGGGGLPQLKFCENQRIVLFNSKHSLSFRTFPEKRVIGKGLCSHVFWPDIYFRCSMSIHPSIKLIHINLTGNNISVLLHLQCKGFYILSEKCKYFAGNSFIFHKIGAGALVFKHDVTSQICTMKIH